jgi:hypothetical protein
MVVRFAIICTSISITLNGIFLSTTKKFLMAGVPHHQCNILYWASDRKRVGLRQTVTTRIETGCR